MLRVQKDKKMYTILSKLDAIEQKLNAHKRISYRGNCEPTHDDPFFCNWDRFYSFAAFFTSACTASLVAVIAKGVMTAQEFKRVAEEEYDKICSGQGHWGMEFSAFLAQGRSTNICSNLMEKKEDAMQGLIQWIWSGLQKGAAIGVTGLISNMNSGLTKFASILRLSHCKLTNYKDPRFCAPPGIPVNEANVVKTTE